LDIPALKRLIGKPTEVAEEEELSKRWSSMARLTFGASADSMRETE